MKEAKNQGAKRFAAIFLLLILMFSCSNIVMNYYSIAEKLGDIDWKWDEAAPNLQQAESVLNEELLYHYRLIDAYGAIQLAMGKHEENAFNKVKDKNGFLYAGNFWNEFGDDTQELAVRTRRLQLQLEEQGVKFGVVLFPENVPEENARYYGIPYNDFGYSADTYAAWARYYGVPVLNLKDNWKENGLSQKDAFFRTDHHWTPLAAFYGYCAIVDWLDTSLHLSVPYKSQLLDLNNYQVVTYEDVMFGSLGRETGLIFAGGPESYTAIYPNEEGHYLLKTGKIEDYDVREGGFSQALMWTDYHLESYDDWYNVNAENTYLYSGVADYTSIQNLDNPSGKKILLLRDSYATPVGAFLSQSFSQVDMLWIGEYTAEELETYLQENKYDYVLLTLYPDNLSYSFFPFGMTEDSE